MSILAKKLGAHKILAVDNDKEIIKNFNFNQSLNNCNVDLRILNCLDIENFNYDLILANINRDILLQLIPKIESKNGILILSGILESDFNIISESLKKQKFTLIKKYIKKEWLCLVIKI